MIHRLLADFTVFLHFGFLVFVVAGGLLVLRFPRLAWVHVPAALWGAAIELGGWICPLTLLENALRRRDDQAAYQGGFLEHYVMPLIYPPGLTREVQILLAAGVIALNGLVYAWVLRRYGRRTRAA